MKSLVVVILGLVGACASVAQNASVAQECSTQDQKTLEAAYHLAALDSTFLTGVKDGELRWLNVTVKSCKLSVVKALQDSGKPAQPDQIIALLDYDDLGEKVLTEKLRRGCSTIVSPSHSNDQEPLRNSAGSTLRIVNDNLVKVNDRDCIGCLYAVKGSIYNPNNDGVKNVVIQYYVWKKYMGDGAPTVNPRTGQKLPPIWRTTGGSVSATIMYLPPKQTVDFIATSYNAPVMTPESGLLPDPISAEITADWDH